MVTKFEYIREKCYERLNHDPKSKMIDFEAGILVGMEYRKENGRSIKELLAVMLDYQDYFRYGLCFWTNNLSEFGLITREESYRLRKYIDNNRPKWYSSFSAFVTAIYPSGYYWKEGDIKPRIEWIKKHIKLNQ